MTVEGIGGEDDEALLAELLAALGRAEPAPAAVLEAGRAALAVRDLDAELALLVWDSELHAPAVTVRGAVTDQLRAMTFEGDGDFTVELEAEATGPVTYTLLGQLQPRPPAPGTGEAPATSAAPAGGLGLSVVLERAGGEPVPLDVDDLGRFLAQQVGAGRLRLRIRRTADRDVLTSWFVLG
jgi:hypothetical protein